MTQTVITPLATSAENMSQRVARRIRGALAENRISGVAFARALHVPQQTLSRKVNGQTPFTLDELALVSEVLGVSFEAVLGVGDYAERSIGLCAIRDLNPEPADSKPLGRLLLLTRRRGSAPTVTGTDPARPVVSRIRHLALVGGAA